MTRRAVGLRVLALERIVRALRVVERRQTEGVGAVASIAVHPRRAQLELPRVLVLVTTRADTGHPSVARTSTLPAIRLRGCVARTAVRILVRTGERPGRVIHARSLPTGGRMAGRAPVLSHLGRELIAMRVLVAAGASVIVDGEGESGARRIVAAAACHGLVLAFEGEGRRRMELDPEGRRRKRPFRVAGPALAAVARGERAVVLVLVAVGAVVEREPAVALVASQLRSMTARTLGLTVRSTKRKRCPVVYPQTQPIRQPEPSNRAVTARAVATEVRLVRILVAADAPRAFGRRRAETGGVAAAALDVRVTAREAQPFAMATTRTIDISPRRLLVAFAAAVAVAAAMRIAVTAIARRELDPTIPRRLSVAGRAVDVIVRAAERKAGIPVVESLTEVDASPTRFVVTRGAALVEASAVWVLVAARAIRTQPEVRLRASLVALRMTIVAAHPPVRARERPARVVVVEGLTSTAGPANEPRSATEVLHVTTGAITAAIGATMEPIAGADLLCEVLVTVEAVVAVDPSPR